MLASSSIHCVVTSPPYWSLRDYPIPPSVWGGDAACDHVWEPGNTCVACGAWRGQLGLEPTPALYVRHMVLVFQEVRRVLRDDGTVWLNLGDSFAQTRNEAVKPKDLVGIPWRVALALQEDGWWLRNDVIWKKDNHLPSPVRDRLTCSHEHVFLLSKRSNYYFDLDAIRVPHTSGRYEGKTFVPKQRWLEKDAPKRKMDLTEGQLGTMAGPPRRMGRGLYNIGGKSPGDVWMFPTQPFAGNHFAVMPQAIPDRCLRAGTSEHGCCAECGMPWERVLGEPGRVQGRGSGTVRVGQNHQPNRRVGLRTNIPWVPTERPNLSWKPGCTCGNPRLQKAVVLDPFSGSATTGKVALKLGRDYIGIDFGEEYLAMASARLRGDAIPVPTPHEAGSVLDLFGEEG